MPYPNIKTQWICNQGGGLKIEIIHRDDSRNWNSDDYEYYRSGDVIYVYTHNNKVGNMINYDEERWNNEWKIIT